MSCLMKYKWVKIPRNLISEGNSLLSDYIRVYSAAAITKGTIRYCQYENAVEEGMWAGGKVGLKSILKARSTSEALERLQRLARFGILTYEYSPDTKYLSYTVREPYRIKNEKTGLPVRCENTYGFIRVPRNVTDRLASLGYVFEDDDARIDLWCHTVSGDNSNVFSFIQPCVQFNCTEPALTLDTLARRWSWTKSKTRRFLARNAAYFKHYKLPGSYGCVIFNPEYGDSRGTETLSEDQILSACRYLQKYGKNRRTVMTDRAHFCILVCKIYANNGIQAFFSALRFQGFFLFKKTLELFRKIEVRTDLGHT